MRFPYRLDFYLPDYNICIECDGSMHDPRYSKNTGKRILNKSELKRDQILKSYNITTIRLHGEILFDETGLYSLINNICTKSVDELIKEYENYQFVTVQ